MNSCGGPGEAIEGRQMGSELIPRPPSPKSLLDHGQTDPFSALPASLPQALIDEYLHISHGLLHSFWAPSSALDPHAQYFSSCVTSMAVDDAALLYGLIGSAMVQIRVLRGEAPTAVEHYIGTRAVTMLNKRLAHTKTALTDATLWAVICVAFFKSVDHGRKGKVPRQSQLKELQNLHIHGRLTPRDVYTRGLSRLIAAIGPENLKVPGTAALCCYGAMITSLRERQRVRMPFYAYTTTYIDPNGRLSVPEHQRMSATRLLGPLGSYFYDVWTTADSQPVPDLLLAIEHLCDFMIILESYNEGCSTTAIPAVIIDQRSYTEHSLLSLPSNKEFEATTNNLCDSLYESCRIACIIFSILVVFPYPPTTAVFENWAIQLKHSLLAENAALACVSDEARDKLRVWVLTMGALVSIGLPLRDWFVTKLKVAFEDLNLRDLGGFMEMVKGFLWHSRTSHRDGLELWREVQQLRVSHLPA